mgnify:FL=1|tara:strand:- start:2757 stop:3254 length:498 start_codon:yes stop_codon:yes gene_type:complete
MEQLIAKLETRVAIAERDIESGKTILAKLDTTIEKMADISSSINQLLHVHEVRIVQMVSETKDIQNTVDQQRITMTENFKDVAENFKEVHSRITTSTRDIRDAAEAHDTNSRSAFANLDQKLQDRDKITEARLSAVERKQWMLTGAFIIFGFIIANIEFFGTLFT